MAKPSDLISTDYERIRESMVEMGEDLDILGFPEPLSLIEGSGPLGRAVQNPRKPKDLALIRAYLKDLAKTLLKGRQQFPQDARIQKALRSVDQTCREFAASFDKYAFDPSMGAGSNPATSTALVRAPSRGVGEVRFGPR